MATVGLADYLTVAALPRQSPSGPRAGPAGYRLGWLPERARRIAQLLPDSQARISSVGAHYNCHRYFILLSRTAANVLWPILSLFERRHCTMSRAIWMGSRLAAAGLLGLISASPSSAKDGLEH